MREGIRTVIGNKKIKHNSAIVVGNGPSAKINPLNCVRDLFVIRVNFYFMEKERTWGDDVSLHIMSTYRRLLWDGIHVNERNGPYNVNQYAFSKESEINSRLKEFDSSSFKSITNYKWFDHFDLFRSDQRVRDIFVERCLGALPTTGISALAVAALHGFEKIYYIGIDLYNVHGARHAFDYPDFQKNNIALRHLEGGYES